jgi:hypothetical protein
MSAVEIRWIPQRVANAFVAKHHSHDGPVRGDIIRAGAFLGGELVGVAILGRPVSRKLDDGRTAEVLRVCTDGQRRTVSGRARGRRAAREHTLPINAMLYDHIARVWSPLGSRILTYTLSREEASALKALGWQPVAEVQPANDRGWSRDGRERDQERYTLLGDLERRTIYQEPKIRWERSAPPPIDTNEAEGGK